MRIISQFIIIIIFFLGCKSNPEEAEELLLVNPPTVKELDQRKNLYKYNFYTEYYKYHLLYKKHLDDTIKFRPYIYTNIEPRANDKSKPLILIEQGGKYEFKKFNNYIRNHGHIYVSYIKRNDSIVFRESNHLYESLKEQKITTANEMLTYLNNRDINYKLIKKEEDLGSVYKNESITILINKNMLSYIYIRPLEISTSTYFSIKDTTYHWQSENYEMLMPRNEWK